MNKIYKDIVLHTLFKGTGSKIDYLNTRENLMVVFKLIYQIYATNLNFEDFFIFGIKFHYFCSKTAQNKYFK